ncbi:hypothetical protein [Caulobacter hibisci]|uniref:hypothetical protein n=1 Tax=Caulobacter hibisci TaxID=2035993 RepID=UPI0018E32398|nr:hypothetical protein [Caulobacter hibisci]
MRAIAGLHVVSLGWDFVDGPPDASLNLLGFALSRAEIVDGEVVEDYPLRGIKRFEDKDEGLPAGSLVSTAEHPVQSFQWGDYTAKPGRTYRYTVTPVYGRSKRLRLDAEAAVSVTVVTEAEQDPRTQGVRHNIFFNRGAAGSQAYARKFGDQRPDPDAPSSPQMAWLSRGLFEALIAFIGRASGPRFSLRAMLYEFQYAPVGQAFKAARDRGADVKVFYEAESYKSHNEEMIKAVGIEDICSPQGERGGIRHNKFIVLLEDDEPVAVWTGSTNISAGGIFGHSNVGHEIWDAEVAGRFSDFWERLSDVDVTVGALKTANKTVEATPAAKSPPPADRILTLFSPRDPTATVPTLYWYGDVLASAQQWAGMTFAFNFDDIFLQALAAPSQALRYLLFDKSLNANAEMRATADGRTVVAAGAKLEAGDLELFVGERLSGFNKNLYIHDKFIVTDPLGEDPVVVTGTANFSKPSQHTNDENSDPRRHSGRRHLFRRVSEDFRPSLRPLRHSPHAAGSRRRRLGRISQGATRRLARRPLLRWTQGPAPTVFRRRVEHREMNAGAVSTSRRGSVSIPADPGSRRNAAPSNRTGPG